MGAGSRLALTLQIALSFGHVHLGDFRHTAGGLAAGGPSAPSAPKIAHAMPPNCDHMGDLVVGPIGSKPELYEDVWLSVVCAEKLMDRQYFLQARCVSAVCEMDL